MEEQATASGEGHGDGASKMDEVQRKFEGLKLQPALDRRFVYFSLGTTGLEGNCQITQIAARRGNVDFNQFVLPEIPIDEFTADSSGITISGEQMFLHGEEVDCRSTREALEKFIEFLDQEPAVLLGHNSRLFHCPRLLNALRECQLVERFQQKGHKFVDTLPIFKKIKKDEVIQKGGATKKGDVDCNLAELCIQYTGSKLMRGAPQISRALQSIMDKAELTSEQLLQNPFNLQDVQDEQRERTERARLYETWKNLVDRRVMFETMAQKASKSGFSFFELRTEFFVKGEAARQMLRDRLTNREDIINKICNYLQENLKREIAERARLVERKVISEDMAKQASKSGFSFIELRTEFVVKGEPAARKMLLKRLTEKEDIINKICNYLQENLKREKAERARLVERKVISEDIASESGFSFIELRTFFHDNGEAAARQMLRYGLTEKEDIIDSILNDLRKGVMAAAEVECRGDDPHVEKFQWPNVRDRRFVFFSLDTTQSERDSHITQIGACRGGDGTGATTTTSSPPFRTFVLPKKLISASAEAVTQIRCEGGVMTHRGEEVHFLKIRPALEAFLQFLETGSGSGGTAGGTKPVVIIVGHNSKSFDWPILQEALRGCDMLDRFRGVVRRCVDTLPMFRELEPALRSHALKSLYSHYTRGEGYAAHEALGDAQALKRVVDLASPGAHMFSKHSFAL